MSALDQAFIKAYTRKPEAAVPNAEDSTCAAPKAEARHGDHTAQPQVNDQAWAEGTWYRSEPTENVARKPFGEQPPSGDHVAEPESAEAMGPSPHPADDSNEQAELVQNDELSGWETTARATPSGACQVVAEYACSESTEAAWSKQPFIDATLAGIEDVAACLAQCELETPFRGDHHAAVAAPDDEDSPSTAAEVGDSQTGEDVAEMAAADCSTPSRAHEEQSAEPSEDVTAAEAPPDRTRSSDQPSLLLTETRAAAGPDAPTLDAPTSDVPVAEPAAGDLKVHDAPDSAADGNAEAPPTSDCGDAIKCQWEVDRFFWPAICNQLYECQAAYFDEAGRRLRDAAGDGANVLGITSIAGGEGKSTLALCLARCAVQAGVRVALVDADWQHPEIGQLLGLDDTCSWSQAISGEMPLAECGVVSHEDGLTVFPLNPAHAKDFATDRLRINQLLHSIARQFELVVLDMGTLDSQAIEMCEDGKNPTSAVILVCDQRQDQEPVEDAVARIQAGGIAAVGIVENFVKASSENLAPHAEHGNG